MTITRHGKRVITSDRYGHEVEKKKPKTRGLWFTLSFVAVVTLSFVVSVSLLQEVIDIVTAGSVDELVTSAMSAFMMFVFGAGSLVAFIPSK